MFQGVAVVHSLVDVHVLVTGAVALRQVAVLHFDACLALAVVLEASARIVVGASALALFQIGLHRCGQRHASARVTLGETTDTLRG